MKVSGPIYVFLVVVLSMVSSAKYANAGQCCLERSDRGPWRLTKLNYAQCDKYNAEKDHDNVLEEEGEVWWDVECSILKIKRPKTVTPAPANVRQCCVIRFLASSGPWTFTRLNYKECHDYNKQQDRDNVLLESGEVWWDVECKVSEKNSNSSSAGDQNKATYFYPSRSGDIGAARAAY